MLVDMAWLKGVDYLGAGTAVTVDDLEAWEKRTANLATAAGFHASVATWLRERDVAAIGSDVVADIL